jgi:hypothetical protein
MVTNVDNVEVIYAPLVGLFVDIISFFFEGIADRKYHPWIPWKTSSKPF